MDSRIEDNFKSAKDFYSNIGIDVEETLKRLKDFSISVQCWQGDDVSGFEREAAIMFKSSHPNIVKLSRPGDTGLFSDCRI